MRTYDLIAFGEPLEAVTRDAPEPHGTEVLLRVTSSGVCHSDVHLRDGYYDLGGGKRLPLPRGVATFPHVLGHEIAGVEFDLAAEGYYYPGETPAPGSGATGEGDVRGRGRATLAVDAQKS